MGDHFYTFRTLLYACLDTAVSLYSLICNSYFEKIVSKDSDRECFKHTIFFNFLPVKGRLMTKLCAKKKVN